MDRRQKKTRKAIIDAFGILLTRKSCSHITVQDIIDEADIGRSTFYAHFGTKDALLQEICRKLFDHVIASAADRAHTHGLYSGKEAPQSVFCHLLQHLREGGSLLPVLLTGENSDLFLRYFRESLDGFIRDLLAGDDLQMNGTVPEGFLVNHISGSFVEMVLWWFRDGRKYTAEEMDSYFRAVIGQVMENAVLRGDSRI